MNRRNLAIGLVAGVGLFMLALLVVANRPQTRDALCRTERAQAFCAGRGWLTPREQASWETAVATRECPYFRGHLRNFPNGFYAESARAAVAAARRAETETWRPAEIRRPLQFTPPVEAVRGVAAAQESAQMAGDIIARRACADVAGEGVRLVSARAEVSEWQCGPVDGGIICAFEGETVCAIETRRVEVRETCVAPAAAD